MAAITNPTQITPPRVPLIDDRTGAISREWYRFFLSMFKATVDNQENSAQLGPDQESLLASYEAFLGDLAQTVETLPRAELGTMAALQQANMPWLTFDNAPEVIPTAVGSLYWDGGTTLGVQMTANVLGRVNEDQFYYIKASAAITKGQVIMFDGAVGASGVIKGKPATGVTNGAYIMGIAAESIANNDFGLVQAFGALRGINTSAFSDGDILWYNPAVAGGLTKTEPVAPNVKVQVAAVTNAASNGSIVIRVTAGSVLGGTDSNVQFTTLADKNMIQYDATAGYWKNISSVPVASGGTGATTLASGYLLKGNGTAAVTASIMYDSGTRIGISTNAPQATFHMYGDTSAVANAYIENGDVAVGGKIGGQYFYSRSVSNAWFSGIDAYVPAGAAGVNQTDLRFYSTSTERFRVKRLGQCRFIPLSTAPGNAEAGDVYYDSNTNKLYCYDGTSWNALF